MQLPGCQRRLVVISGASDTVISPKSATCDKEGEEVAKSECHTTTGSLLCEKYTARDENGMDDIEGYNGAARES